MFTDLVGFSKLTQVNEALALEVLETHWDLVRPVIEEFNGTEIKTIGDAFLIEYPSALQAVRAGLAIQEKLEAHNGANDSDHQIRLRIGIHMGDVERRGNDVFGDGVNIAARIEPLAEAGGICITDSVYASVHNKVDTPFYPMGERELKNIDQPVAVFSNRPGQGIAGKRQNKRPWLLAAVLLVALVSWISVDRGWISLPGQPSTGTNAQTLPQQQEAPDKSIAVLPFVNMSSDPEQEHFADGISEEILNLLAKARKMKVAGRTSSFSFKGKNEDLRVIGEALDVSHILEGSVRKSGVTLRITAQLIEAAGGYHLWSETYDRELDDVFAIQDEISRAILDQLEIHMGVDGPEAEPRSKPVDTEAYGLYLAAKENIYGRTEESLLLAVEQLEHAVAIDSKYAPVLAQFAIATLLLSDYSLETDDIAEATSRAKALLDKAVELDSDSDQAYAGMGLYYLTPGTGDSDKQAFIEAEKALRKAISINPNNINARNWLANTLDSRGEFAASMAVVEDLLEIDPLYSPAIGNAAYSYYISGDMQKLQALASRSKSYLPNHPIVYRVEANLQHRLGNLSAEIRLLETAFTIDEEPSIRNQLAYALSQIGDWGRVIEVGEDWQTFDSLLMLGRGDEARAIGDRLFKEWDVSDRMIYIHSFFKEFESIVELVETHYSNSESIKESLANPIGEGNFLLCVVAHAFQQTGNMERSREVIQIAQAANERSVLQGANNYNLTQSQACLELQKGDEELAVTLLEKAHEQGMYHAVRMEKIMPVYERLVGNPRYEALQTRMMDHINRERAKLGLDPLAP